MVNCGSCCATAKNAENTRESDSKIFFIQEGIVAGLGCNALVAKSLI
jgi:hypothetical protein